MNGIDAQYKQSQEEEFNSKFITYLMMIVFLHRFYLMHVQPIELIQDEVDELIEDVD